MFVSNTAHLEFSGNPLSNMSLFLLSGRDASPHHTVRERYRGSNDSPPNICYDYFEHNSSDSCPSDGGAPFWASAAAGTRPMGFPSDRFSPNTSGASTPVHIVYPSMEESWLVTPPPCFTAGGNSPHRMETSPLENLLIEHPSMSVYTSRGRPHSTGVESSDSENEDVDEAQPERVVASVRQPPHQGRAVAARVGLAAQGAMARSMQVSKQRQEARQVCRSKLQRSNQALHQASANRHPRRKHYMLRSSGRSNNRHNYTC